jgi:hypothetical protein
MQTHPQVLWGEYAPEGCGANSRRQQEAVDIGD